MKQTVNGTVYDPEDDPLIQWMYRRLQLAVAKYVNSSPRKPAWSVGKLEFDCIRNGYCNMKYDFDPERPTYFRAGLEGYENVFAGRLLHEELKILPIQELHVTVYDDEEGEYVMFGHIDDIYYDGKVLLDKKTLKKVESYTKNYLPRTMHCRQTNYYRALVKNGIAAEDILDVTGFPVVDKGDPIDWDIKRQIILYMSMNAVLTKCFWAEPSSEWLGTPTRAVFRNLLEKRRTIKECLEDDTIPLPEPGWECLTPDTLIHTLDGLKYITEIKVGDFVCSRGGFPDKVLYVNRREINEKIINLNPHYFLSIRLTGNHPVLVRDGIDDRYVEAKDLTTEMYMHYPIPRSRASKRFLDIDKNKRFILGLFMAEGCWDTPESRNRYVFTLSSKETSLIEKLIKTLKKEFNTDSTIADRDTYVHIRGSSEELRAFIDKYVDGDKALNKKFKYDMMVLRPSAQMDVLDAMLLGDGYKIGKQTVYTTASKILAKQVQIIWLRNNIVSGICAVKQTKFSDNLLYRIAHYGDNIRYGFIEEDTLFVKIRDISKVVYKGFVYNFETELTNAYQTESGVVHNCQYCSWYDFCVNNDDYDDYTMPHEMVIVLDSLPAL